MEPLSGENLAEEVSGTAAEGLVEGPGHHRGGIGEVEGVVLGRVAAGEGLGPAFSRADAWRRTHPCDAKEEDAERALALVAGAFRDFAGAVELGRVFYLSARAVVTAPSASLVACGKRQSPRT